MLLQQLRQLRLLGALSPLSRTIPAASLSHVLCGLHTSNRLLAAANNKAASSPAAAAAAAAAATTTVSGRTARTAQIREAYYRRRDHIADEYTLIYRAHGMELTIAGCKHFASASLAVTAVAATYNWATTAAIVDIASGGISFGPLMSDVNELFWFVPAFLAFNAAIVYACGRLPLRIYRHRQRYVAMFEGNLPLVAKAVPFRAGEVTEAFGGILPWHESMYRMRRRSVLLMTNYFKTPSELHVMINGADGQDGADQEASEEKTPPKY